MSLTDKLLFCATTKHRDHYTTRVGSAGEVYAAQIDIKPLHERDVGKVLLLKYERVKYEERSES